MKTGLILAVGLILPQFVMAQEERRAVIPILVASPEETGQISVTVDPGLRSSKRLPTAELRNARAAMQAGESVSPDNLRRLADAGDGLAAQRYVRILLSADDTADPSDIAYYAAVAVGTGRVWTLKPMIEAMHSLDPKTEPKARVTKYIRVLYPHAWAGNSIALDALVAFNGKGRLFGPMSDKTRDRILNEARAQGDGRTELSLAMGLLERARASDTPDPQIIAKARAYLVLAQGSNHLAVRTTAQNLILLIDNG
ncbi:MAG: hypothetical protein WBB25_09420 [Sulfitobacter sp.]